MTVFHPALGLAVFIVFAAWAVNLSAGSSKVQKQLPLHGYTKPSPYPPEDVISPVLPVRPVPDCLPLTRKPLNNSQERAEIFAGLQPGEPHPFQATVGGQLIDTILLLDGSTGINSLKTLLSNGKFDSKILVLISGHNGPISWDQGLSVNKGKRVILQGIGIKNEPDSSGTLLPEILLPSTLLSHRAALTISDSASVLASNLDFVTQQDSGVAPVNLEPVFMTAGKGRVVIDKAYFTKIQEPQHLYEGNVHYGGTVSADFATPVNSDHYRHSADLRLLRLLAALFLFSPREAQTITTTTIAPTILLEPGLMTTPIAQLSTGLITGVVWGIAGVVALGATAVFTVSEIIRWRSGKRPKVLELIDRCRKITVFSHEFQEASATQTP